MMNKVAMKSPLFQLIACAVVLGMMGGGVVIHSLHVAGARELSEGARWESGASAPGAEAGSFVTPAAFLKAERSMAMAPGEHHLSARSTSATIDALEEIVARLQELKVENKSLVGQLKETNRDLMELQFRVDSHSESFRPMRVSAGPVERHLLLPPKGR